MRNKRVRITRMGVIEYLKRNHPNIKGDLYTTIFRRLYRRAKKLYTHHDKQVFRIAMEVPRG